MKLLSQFTRNNKHQQKEALSFLSRFFLTSCSPPVPQSESEQDQPDSNPNPPEFGPSSLAWRVERLPRGASVVSAFQSWMRDGLAVNRGHIFHAVNRLRRRNLHFRALEVMEWVMRERPYKLSELEYSFLLEFTCKLHGISHGERLFLNVPKEHQNKLLYNNLIMACLDQGQIKLSYAYMRKMREFEFPISPFIYNRLIIIHSSPGRRKTIPKILTQMKADKITRHVSTFNILLKIHASDHNIDGMTKVFDEMTRVNVEPNEITHGILALAHAVARLYTVSETYVEALLKSRSGNNWSTLDILIMLYGYLNKEKELEKIWVCVQKLPHVRSKSYLLAIEAFGKVGSVSKAEEIWTELKIRKKIREIHEFNSILSVYCRHGMISKACEIYKEILPSHCKPNAITYRHLALGCLKAGLVDDAIKTIKMGGNEMLTNKVRKSTPWLETTFMVLEMFGEMGDLDNAKKIFEELKESKYCRNTFVYNALLKGYVKARVYEPDLLKNMILDGARPDAETYSLLRLVEQFKSDEKRDNC
ncbi:hypothetical protein LUZ60_011645 [Juncus effusus]|nr:hypothetical protein LUZ60_011645 [Juncus effusus]